MKFLLTFSDLPGNLTYLEIACTRCERRGKLNVARLIEKRRVRATIASAIQGGDGAVRHYHPGLAAALALV